MIYRRFGFLHARLLLQKQDELREMERTLDQIDKADLFSEDALALQSRKADENRVVQDGTKSRPALLSKIEDTILKYGNISLKQL
jgi:hypothetical protein